MLKIPENTRYFLKLYKKFYNVLIIKKLLYKYDLITSYKIISKKLTLKELYRFIIDYSKYITDENPKEIYEKIKKDYIFINKKYKNRKLKSFNNKELIIQKIKQTKLERYGDPNYCNTSKIAETKLKNHGNSGYVNPEKQKETRKNLDYTEIIKKCKQTKLERYGDENYNNMEKICKTKLDIYNDAYYTNREKYQETCSKRIKLPKIRKIPDYQEIVKKGKQTKLEKYGDSNYNNIEKIKQTKLERYNDENYNNIEKIKESNILKYGKFNSRSHIEKFDELISEEFWKSKADELNRVSKSEMKEYFNISNNTYSKYKPNEIQTKKKFGNLESKFLFDIESKYNIKLEKQFKIIFDKNIYYIVDGFDVSSNTIYEFLGDYWHGRSQSIEICCFKNKTFKELYDETFDRFYDLSKLGYKIKYIWESDYLNSGLEFLRNF